MLIQWSLLLRQCTRILSLCLLVFTSTNILILESINVGYVVWDGLAKGRALEATEFDCKGGNGARRRCGDLAADRWKTGTSAGDALLADDGHELEPFRRADAPPNAAECRLPGTWN